MMIDGLEPARGAAAKLFVPSRRAATSIGSATILTFAAALLLRYGIIQNTPVGLACEAGETSLACTIRSATIGLFSWSLFGTVALIIAIVQLWRPSIRLFGAALMFAAAGLVLYNTRAAGLAVALLVISLARVAPAKR